MNSTQYRQARRLLRDNGTYALRWLPTSQAATMSALMSQRGDPLQDRASWRDGTPAAIVVRLTTWL